MRFRAVHLWRTGSESLICSRSSEGSKADWPDVSECGKWVPRAKVSLGLSSDPGADCTPAPPREERLLINWYKEAVTITPWGCNDNYCIARFILIALGVLQCLNVKLFTDTEIFRLRKQQPINFNYSSLLGVKEEMDRLAENGPTSSKSSKGQVYLGWNLRIWWKVYNCYDKTTNITAIPSDYIIACVKRRDSSSCWKMEPTSSKYSKRQLYLRWEYGTICGRLKKICVGAGIRIRLHNTS